MRSWLRDARITHHFTQLALAEKIGVDITAIGKYELGERRPSVDIAKRIAHALGFDWTRFYEDGETAPETTEAAQ